MSPEDRAAIAEAAKRTAAKLLEFGNKSTTTYEIAMAAYQAAGGFQVFADEIMETVEAET